MSYEKRAIFPISLSTLHSVLGLPEGVRIVAADASWITKTVNLEVIGPGLPDSCRVAVGEDLRRLQPLFTGNKNDGSKFEAWQ